MCFRAFILKIKKERSAIKKRKAHKKRQKTRKKNTKSRRRFLRILPILCKFLLLNSKIFVTLKAVIYHNRRAFYSSIFCKTKKRNIAKWRRKSQQKYQTSFPAIPVVPTSDKASKIEGPLPDGVERLGRAKNRSINIPAAPYATARLPSELNFTSQRCKPS